MQFLSKTKITHIYPRAKLPQSGKQADKPWADKQNFDNLTFPGKKNVFDFKHAEKNRSGRDLKSRP